TSTTCISPPRRRRRPRPGAVTKKSASRVAPSRARWTSMKPPAPGPVSGLSVTPAAKAAATHASTAFPPSARARAPACAVGGWPRATAPFIAESLAGRPTALSAQERRGVEQVAARRRARSRKTATTQTAEAGRDDRDPELAGESVVDGRAEDDVRVV